MGGLALSGERLDCPSCGLHALPECHVVQVWTCVHYLVLLLSPAQAVNVCLSYLPVNAAQLLRIGTAVQLVRCGLLSCCAVLSRQRQKQTSATATVDSMQSNLKRGCAWSTQDLSARMTGLGCCPPKEQPRHDTCTRAV